MPNDGDYQASKVVVATGTFQRPKILSFGSRLTGDVQTMRLMSSITSNRATENSPFSCQSPRYRILFRHILPTLGFERELLGPSSMSEEEQHIARLRQWIQGHPRWSMQVYRTRAGLRCLTTHDTFDPSLGSTTEVLKSLGADPLYVTLCKNQASFRARLTPKPWRCGVETPPNKYPWENEIEQQRYRRWEDQYERVIADFTTCRLVAVIGRTRPHRDAAMIQDLHYRYTCINDKFRLA